MDVLRKTMIVVFGGVMAAVLLNSCLLYETLTYKPGPQTNYVPRRYYVEDVRTFYKDAPIKWHKEYNPDSLGKLDIRGFYTRSQLDIYPDTDIIFYPDGYLRFFDNWGLYEVKDDKVMADIFFYSDNKYFEICPWFTYIGIVEFEIEDSAHINCISIKNPKKIKEVEELNRRNFKWNNWMYGGVRMPDTIVDLTKECSNHYRLVRTDDVKYCVNRLLDTQSMIRME